jgi:hypothetical protein
VKKVENGKEEKREQITGKKERKSDITNCCYGCRLHCYTLQGKHRFTKHRIIPNDLGLKGMRKINMQ